MTKKTKKKTEKTALDRATDNVWAILQEAENLAESMFPDMKKKANAMARRITILSISNMLNKSLELAAVLDLEEID